MQAWKVCNGILNYSSALGHLQEILNAADSNVASINLFIALHSLVACSNATMLSIKL